MKNKKIMLIFATVVVMAIISAVFFLLLDSYRSNESNFEAKPVSSQQVGENTAAPENSLQNNASLNAALDGISSDRMYITLEDLTSIESHSGWRGSATSGEKQALDYLQDRLRKLTWLNALGMTDERESFRVFLGTEDHTSSVFFSNGIEMVEIPADATRGNRDNLSLAIKMDSDGKFNDLIYHPVQVEGDTLFIPDENVLTSLAGSLQTGKIFLVNYALVDTVNPLAMTSAQKLLDLDPAAIVLITRYSNVVGENHGTFVGDGGGVFQRLSPEKTVPLLFIELENLALLDVKDWDDISGLTRARVVWDTDISNPAESGNLIIHIPGKNHGKPILLSAHIDSANSPGALDDGTGSAILLETITILNEKQIQPESDLYLAWYGSEEIGLYGSTYFTTTHSELLNQLQANIQIDSLSRPLDGLDGEITLTFSHFVSPGIQTEPLANYLLARAADLGFNLNTDFWPLASDNGPLTAFNIPNLDLIYESDEMNKIPGGIWVAGHYHDPYDTVARVREMESELLGMTKLVLSAALIPNDEPAFVEHTGEKKAVFLANHTEAPHMTPAGISQFSITLIRAGYQIKVVPSGNPVNSEDLAGADLVVVLPPYDFPVEGTATVSNDTSWSVGEAEILNDYVTKGGRVLVLNSAHRLKFYNVVTEANEDWSDLNVLTEPWGVSFNGVGADTDLLNTEDRGVLEGVPAVHITPENAVYFQMNKGNALAGIASKAFLAHIKVGLGEVIIIGDLTILGENSSGLTNPQLVSNLAEWE